MAAERVISLTAFPWTVRAAHAKAVVFPPGAERGCKPKEAAYDEPDYREDLARGVPARIPGCVHQALVNDKLIWSPDTGDEEQKLQWIGRTEWEYRCEFDWPESRAAASADHIELVIDGLDTVAALALNGTPIGDAASFHFPHRFDIARALRAGRNELVIRFTPPLAHIRAEQARLGPRPFNGDEGVAGGTGVWDPFIFIRKPACNLGWDWGPKIATVGIAGEVTIERWRSARIEHVRPLITRADAEVAEVRVHVDAVVDPRCTDPLRATITLHDPRGRGIVARGECEIIANTKPGRATGSALLSIESPELWWPRGYGPESAEQERPRYNARIQLRSRETLLDESHTRIGLRTVALDTSPDNWGSAFTLRINGQSIFCQGANWIPEGLFAGYASEDVIRERIRDAAAMNANMLRVWGGGLYEPECFYDECDRRGMLVWQDFMFACGMYPEEPPYGGDPPGTPPDDGLIAREARHQLARLSSHASVVLWCGGNETIWGHDKWGWRERLKGEQSWGRGFWLDLLPRLCAQVDPSRPYWPNSPWSGVDANSAAAPSDTPAHRDVLDSDHGDRHTWEVEAWGPRPETEGFRSPSPSGVPRFCSEFGQQSPPCVATLSWVPGFLDGSQRGPGGDARWYDVPLAAVFGPPGAPLRPLRERSCCEREFFLRWHYLAQVLQARVVSRGIEWHRVHRPRCGGALFWQLNDCWAGHSWSAIDAAGRKKPLWFAARRAMSPRLLSIHVVDGVPMLFGVNDTDAAWEGEIVSRRAGFDGASLREWRTHARLGPRTAGVLADLCAKLGAPDDPKRELLIAEAEGFARGVHFHLPDHELEYPRIAQAEALDLRVVTSNDGVMLHLHARTLIRDLVVEADDHLPHQPASDNMLTLLPGESATLRLAHAPMSMSEKGLRRSHPPVQWVNQSPA